MHENRMRRSATSEMLDALDDSGPHTLMSYPPSNRIVSLSDISDSTSIHRSHPHQMAEMIHRKKVSAFLGTNVDRQNFAERPHMARDSCKSVLMCGVIVLSAIVLSGCESLTIPDTSSLFFPGFQKSEVFGFVAGLGTTFAAVPDLVGMFRRRSSKGINPTMASIIGVFQIVWIYYGLLIVSRPVIAWNLLGVIINFMTVGAYLRFARRAT